MSPVNNPRSGQKIPTKTPTQSTSGNNSKGIIIAAVAVACLVGGYFLYKGIKTSLDAKPKTIIVHPTPADTIQQVVKDSLTMEQPAVVVKQETSTSVPKGFYIIVGSFQNKNNAERMVKNLKKDVELTALYFEELNLYRVSAGHYDNIHTAYNDTYSIKDLDGCTNAWVLENQ